MKKEHKIILICLSVVVLVAVVYFFLKPMFEIGPVQVNEMNCVIDEDCACGVHIRTGQCFYGNKNFVDTSPEKACPDFCSGISGDLEIRCANSICVQN